MSQTCEPIPGSGAQNGASHAIARAATGADNREATMAGKQHDRLSLRIRLLGEIAAEGPLAILAMVVIGAAVIVARAMGWI